MPKRPLEAPTAGDSPGAADSSPSPAAPGSFSRLIAAHPNGPGPAEVLEMLHEVRESTQRAFDDMLDAAYWVDHVQQGSAYEVGIIRRCMEHSRELLALWARRCEAEARRLAK